MRKLAEAKIIETQSKKWGSITNNFDSQIQSSGELMIDSESGKIAYAVLSFGGWLGANNKLFTIPWESHERNRDDYILRVDKSVLENAKGFDKEKWSLTLDELANAYKICGVQPYWK
jgi:hypothetical protein